MALIQCDFFSDVLGLCMTMHVILPQQTSEQIGLEGKTTSGRHPILFLLHGLSDDHSIWLRRTSIERYVAPLGLAVVMPAVHRSFYADMKHGDKYWTYISEEIPSLAREFFPLSDQRDQTFVAGLSMGGYGAFKLALNCPEAFCAAASLSGVLCLEWSEWYEQATPDMQEQLNNTFGDGAAYKGSRNDLAARANSLCKTGILKPKLYQCCGTDDSLLEANRRFKQFIEPLGFDYTYEEEPGAHEWGYWDTKIKRVLEWLPL